MGHAQLRPTRLTLEPCFAYPVVRCPARLCWPQQQAQQHPPLAHVRAPGAVLPTGTDAAPSPAQLPLSTSGMAALLAAAQTCGHQTLRQGYQDQEHCPDSLEAYCCQHDQQL